MLKRQDIPQDLASDTWGDRVNRARLATGKTQAEFAQALGCYVGTIQNHEVGRVVKPSGPLVRAFNNYMGRTGNSHLKWEPARGYSQTQEQREG